MKNQVLLFLLLGGVSVAGAGWQTAQVAWAGAAPLTRTLTLPSAAGLALDGDADITLAEGHPQQLVVSGSARLLDQLRAEVQTGILHVHAPASAGWWLWHPAERLKITVTLPLVKQIHLTGAATLTGLTPFTSPALTVALAGANHATLSVANTRTDLIIKGAGTVTLCGTTTKQQVRIDGAGTYHGFGLRSMMTTASLAGVGTEEVTATQSLTANVAGIGTIRYRGQPAATALHANGLGRVYASQ